MKSTAAEVLSASPSQLRVMPTSSGHAMLLSAEEFPIYHLHITRFITEFRPQDQWESDLVQRIADNHWRLDRIARLEMALYARGRLEFASLYPEEKDGNVRSVLIEAHIHLTYARPLNNLSVQESRLRRYIATDLTELRRLQAERLEREAEKKPLTASAAASSTHHPQFASPTSENQNGFEFSNSLSTDSPRSQPELPVYTNGKITRH